jgi:hypothetical protein
MKIYTDSVKANKAMKEKTKYYLNGTCPYNTEGRMCGSWCALFYLSPASKTEHQSVSAMVILGCKSGEKNLYVSEFVED